jgi:hypothetical protein
MIYYSICFCDERFYSGGGLLFFGNVYEGGGLMARGGATLSVSERLVTI